MTSAASVRQLFRYDVVGVITNLVGYGIYLLLTAFLLPPKLTMTILYISGAVLGFVGNRQFTFDHKGKVSRAALAYGAVHCAGWAMNYAILYVFSDRLGYPHQGVQAVAIVVVAGYLFLALRWIVFPKRAEAEGPAK